MPEFQPSRKSETSEEQTAATLRYLKKAVEVVERQLKKDGSVPVWVESRINQAAATMGMAVSYVAARQEREFQPGPTKKKPRSKS